MPAFALRAASSPSFQDCVAFIRRFEDDYKFRPRYLIENYRSTRHMINACTK
ncbi:MAG: hypothetical protein IPM40_17155 [Gammaproteobacteria bacterium]|jgi:hypothetical protein|nr:hypothetical protein [Gammaproteobacteria bacterium]MBK9468902.1 hypothetical protein [Gammaproteobacteria bacterium]MBP6481122.1 hypothetical protein [Pseudomonadales bacterium]MBP7910531.1 hypothetical protein [Pseudomonadales bacterium]